MCRWFNVLLAVLILATFGCSQTESTPKPRATSSGPPVASPRPAAVRADTPPPKPRVSLSPGMLYQSSVPVALSSQAGGPTAQTIPANGYFRATSTESDGWYQVSVSDRVTEWMMWLDGGALSKSDLHETPTVETAAPMSPSYVQQRPNPPNTHYQQQSVAPVQATAGAQQVYITRTGKDFHSAGCRHLSKSKIPISRADANARGYMPCSVCRP
jgi:hypothetical protein